MKKANVRFQLTAPVLTRVSFWRSSPPAASVGNYCHRVWPSGGKPFFEQVKPGRVGYFVVQSKYAKRTLGLSLLALLMILGYHGYVLLFTVRSGGKPPPWTYGEGKFVRFKSVTGGAECAALAALLEAEKAEEFNRTRKALGLDDRFLDLKGLRLVGKDLAGVNLSKCVLTGCDFSGSNLRGASFKQSYVAQTTFLGPFGLQNGDVTPKMARRTDLTGSHFDGATLEGTVYSWVEMGYSPFKCRPSGHTLCVLTGSSGLAGLPLSTEWDIPMKITPTGSQILPRRDRPVTNFASVSVSCENPFRDIPDSALEQWAGMNVDIQRLRSMPARRLDASRFALRTHTIVNSDTNLVVAITDSFNHWVDVLSAGPLVAMNQAYGFSRLLSESTLWIRDEASFDHIIVGRPIVVSTNRKPSFGRALLSPMYMWNGGAVKERYWMKQLLEEKPIAEVATMIGRSSPVYIQSADRASGLKALLGEARARSLIGQHPEAAHAQLAIASGTHFGSGAVDIIQTNPAVTLVLQKGFATHGAVFSAGPVVVVGSAQADPVLSQSWIDGANWRYHPAISLK